MAVSSEETIRQLTAALQGLKASSRKPDIPAFDPKCIELWIKRVDNAYRRAGISDPKDKFAFLETKFPVNADPNVNTFIFGEGTQQSWEEFVSYLTLRYGRSKQQRAATILDGVRRDGRKPSEMFAHVKERIGDLTLDDVLKEMVMRELPPDLQRVLHDKTKDLSGADAVKLADTFFDRDGKPIHKSAPAPVSQVVSPNYPGLVDTTDDENEDVNAVSSRPKNRPGNKQRQFHSNQNAWDGTPKRPPVSSQDKGMQRQPHRQEHNAPNAAPAPQAKRENYGRQTVRTMKLCKYHSLFGNDARTCEASCDKYPKWLSSNGKAGRQT